MKQMPTKMDFIVCLARHLFDETAAAQVIDMYSKHGGRGGHGVHGDHVADADLADVTEVLLKHMDQDNLAHFADLKDKAIRKITKSLDRAQENGPRASRENCTPEHLKQRVPGAGAIPGVYIMENLVRKVYVASYPGGRPFETCSRSWGPRSGRTREAALELVLAWQHAQHELAHARDRKDHGDRGAQPEEVQMKETTKRRKIGYKQASSVPAASVGVPSSRPYHPMANVLHKHVAPCTTDRPMMITILS